MPYENTNIPVLDRQEPQSMCVLPVATAAGRFIIAPQSGVRTYAMYVTSATAVYLYNHENDGFIQVASPALAGTFAVGACGVRHTWSIPYTATGSSDTVVTVNTAVHPLTGVANGAVIEMLSGTAANIGLRRTVTNFYISGTTAYLTLNTALPASVANTDTFKLNTGRFYVLNAYTSLAAGVFKVFDTCTMAWQSSLATTGLPAAWGTSGKMVTTYTRLDVIASGTATSGSATTLVNSAKNWATNQWVNYQVRITAGTGCGQVRTITANDATSLTFASGATIDSTSEYAIEGNEDFLYLLGNNATTVYRYSISGNSWSTVATRPAASTTVMMAEWIGVTGNSAWADETNIQDGRYIYSPRGQATVTLYRYDIPSNTWATITHNSAETFTTGSSMTSYKNYLFVIQNATGKIFQYDCIGNNWTGYTTDTYTQSTAVEGDKIWLKLLDETGSVVWLYYALNTSTVLRRIMVY